MYRYALLLMVAVTLTFAGCANKEADLKIQLSTAQELINSLRTERNETGALYSKALDERNAALNQLDTARQQIAKLEPSLAAKTKALKAEKAKTAKLMADVDSLKAVSAQLPKCWEELGEQKAKIQFADNQISQLQEEISVRDTLVTNLMPWYAYYKHEASRGFFKHLFGSGHAKKPDIPELP
ncbi:MAG: hypothetical protein WCV50_06650 [Patescibacteria group bacterium]|jgi:chromosome segregation ATPase